MIERGGVEALAAQLCRFAPLVGACARRYAGRGAEYEDLVQEGNIALLSLLPRCRNLEALPLFLKRALPRAVRDAAERLRRSAYADCDALDEMEDDAHPACERTTEQVAAWMLLESLSREERALVVALAEGRSQAEAGRRIGVSRSAAGERLARLRQRLSKELREERDAA